MTKKKNYIFLFEIQHFSKITQSSNITGVQCNNILKIITFFLCYLKSTRIKYFQKTLFEKY